MSFAFNLNVQSQINDISSNLATQIENINEQIHLALNPYQVRDFKTQIDGFTYQIGVETNRISDLETKAINMRQGIYQTGWFYVAKNNYYLKTHNLNLTNNLALPRVRVYFNDTTIVPVIGVNQIYEISPMGNMYSGFEVRFIDANTIVIQIHPQHIFQHYYSGTDYYDSGYMNVILY